MTIKVRYLSEDKIEQDAELLLAGYEETTGAPIKLPVPVAEITTYHLALRLGFADLHQTLGVPMLSVTAVEEFERLKALDAWRPLPPDPKRKGAQE
jgi:hypothetical protein